MATTNFNIMSKNSKMLQYFAKHAVGDKPIGMRHDKYPRTTGFISLKDHDVVSKLKLMKYKHNRKVSSDHVDYLIREDKLRRLFPCNTLAFAEDENGKYHLINGNNTLSAISAQQADDGYSNMASETAMAWVAYAYTTNHDDDIGEIHSRWDVNKTRTPTQRFKALGISDILGITDTDRNLLNAAISINLGNGSSQIDKATKLKTKSPEDRVLLMQYYYPAFCRYMEVVAMIPNKSRYGTHAIAKKMFKEVAFIAAFIKAYTVESDERIVTFIESLATGEFDETSSAAVIWNFYSSESSQLHKLLRTTARNRPLWTATLLNIRNHLDDVLVTYRSMGRLVPNTNNKVIEGESTLIFGASKKKPTEIKYNRYITKKAA